MATRRRWQDDVTRRMQQLASMGSQRYSQLMLSGMPHDIGNEIVQDRLNGIDRATRRQRNGGGP